MMLFKFDTDIDGIQKETISAMAMAYCTHKFFCHTHLGDQLDFVVTSVLDGRHRVGSKHYTGEAFDIRTWTSNSNGVQWDQRKKSLFATMLQQALGNDYDVVVEKTHIHVEFDPTF